MEYNKRTNKYFCSTYYADRHFADNRERTLIIDTKYYSKILQQQYGKETIRNNNLYQISTYVNEYDKEHHHNVDGMLLYAKTKNDDFDDATIKHRDGYSLFVRTLDLNTNFEEIKKRLESYII